MKTCHLFAGTHKAGSTAVQRFFADHEVELADRGVTYARSGREGDDHRTLARALADGDRGGVADRFRAELADVAGDVVVASELFGDVFDKAPMPGALLDLIGSVGYRTHVILFIRPQAPYLNSRYAQLVKQLRCDLEFGAWVETQLGVHRFDYHAHFAWMVDDDRFGFDAVPFDARLLDEGVVQTALHLIGVDVADLDVADRVQSNRIPGPKTIEYLLSLQHGRPEISSMDHAARRAVAIEANAEAARQGWNDARFDGVTPSIRRRIDGYYAASNEAFSQAVWGRPWSEVFAE